MDDIRFEWDEKKNKENIRKHGVPFEEAQTVFLDENAMLEGEVSYADGKENDSDPSDYTAWSWGVRYEKAFTDHPIAWFLEYHGMQIEESNGGDDELMEHTFLVGLRMYFGAGSLMENDRRGATFDTPDVGRWTGWTVEVVD